VPWQRAFFIAVAMRFLILHRTLDGLATYIDNHLGGLFAGDCPGIFQPRRFGQQGQHLMVAFVGVGFGNTIGKAQDLESLVAPQVLHGEQKLVLKDEIGIQAAFGQRVLLQVPLMRLLYFSEQFFQQGRTSIRICFRSLADSSVVGRICLSLLSFFDQYR
jgi:hypothetical protein